MPAFTFNANEFDPSFGSGNKVMPCNKVLVMIDNSAWVETKTHDGEFISADYIVLEGPQKGFAIRDKFNLHNNSATAVEIAQRELSALCHVIGIYNLSAPEGAPPLMMLHNKPFRIDVGWQKGNEPTEEKPNGGYTEVKAMYDANGNRPGADNGNQSNYKPDDDVLASAPRAPEARPVSNAKVRAWAPGSTSDGSSGAAPGSRPWSPKR